MTGTGAAGCAAAGLTTGAAGRVAGAAGPTCASSGADGSETAAAAINKDLRGMLIDSTNPFFLKDNPLPHS
jgi:hypothetical protein